MRHWQAFEVTAPLENRQYSSPSFEMKTGDAEGGAEERVMVMMMMMMMMMMVLMVIQG